MGEKIANYAFEFRASPRAEVQNAPVRSLSVGSCNTAWTPRVDRTARGRIAVEDAAAADDDAVLGLCEVPVVAQQEASPALTSVAEADSSCAKCHETIYRRYLKTPMANASGAYTALYPGFSHAPSGSRIAYQWRATLCG